MPGGGDGGLGECVCVGIHIGSGLMITRNEFYDNGNDGLVAVCRGHSSLGASII